MLENHPRMQLIYIINQYGESIIDNPSRCRALLKDLAPKHQREINLLMLTLDEKIVNALCKNNSQTPLPILVERLAQRLHLSQGTQIEFAAWAVESWARALKLIQSPSSQQDTIQTTVENSKGSKINAAIQTVTTSVNSFKQTPSPGKVNYNKGLRLNLKAKTKSIVGFWGNIRFIFSIIVISFFIISSILPVISNYLKVSKNPTPPMHSPASAPIIAKPDPNTKAIYSTESPLHSQNNSRPLLIPVESDHVNPATISGEVTKVVDVDTIFIDNKEINLAWIAPVTIKKWKKRLEYFIKVNGSKVTCFPHDARYQCFTIKGDYDLAVIAIRNGAAHVNDSAPKNYKDEYNAYLITVTERKSETKVDEQVADPKLPTTETENNHDIILVTQAIAKKIEATWNRPFGMKIGLKCIVRVKLLPSGDVKDAKVISSSGNAAFDNSAENAVRKASPLPVPHNRNLFIREFKIFNFNFKF